MPLRGKYSACGGVTARGPNYCARRKTCVWMPNQECETYGKWPYNGKQYVVRMGKQGGAYIMAGGAKVYIKTLKKRTAVMPRPKPIRARRPSVKPKPVPKVVPAPVQKPRKAVRFATDVVGGVKPRTRRTTTRTGKVFGAGEKVQRATGTPCDKPSLKEIFGVRLETKSDYKKAKENALLGKGKWDVSGRLWNMGYETLLNCGREKRWEA